MKLATVLFLGAIIATAAIFAAEPATATTGVDVSQATLPDAWKCLKSNGFDYGIIRCYESVGRPDSNCPHTIYNAWDGGMDHVDIYMFPDPSKGNPEGQVDDMVAYLAKFNIKPNGSKPATYGMLWLDIEGPQYWSKSQGSNQAFFNGLVAGAKAHGIPLGVYTSESQWIPIMGDWSGGASLPLWYAHYDGNPSFSDFRAFAGWSRPSIKQYRGNVALCGAGIDENWYPSGVSGSTNTTLTHLHLP